MEVGVWCKNIYAYTMYLERLLACGHTNLNRIHSSQIESYNYEDSAKGDSQFQSNQLIV